VSENKPSIEILKDIGQSAGGVFRFGTGVMGKSAILMFVLLVVFGLAIWKLQGTAAIVGIAILGALTFFLWLIAILRYTSKHPEAALLEGAEWTAWKKFEASAKTVVNPPALPAIADPNAPPLPPGTSVEEPDK
jgi:hypothetical protein